MRVLLPVVLLASACTAEFPPLRVEAGPGLDAMDAAVTDGAEPPFDLTAPPVDLGGAERDQRPIDGDPALDAATPHDAQPVDAELKDALTLLPDAMAVDLAPLPDMAPPPPLVLLDAEQAPAEGCAPRTVTLRWRTEHAMGCRLFANDNLLEQVEGGALVEGRSEVGGVVEDNRFALACAGAGGEAEASFVATFDPALPPRRDLRRDDQSIAQTQRQCAGALFERVMGNDGAVGLGAATAARLCACRGYTAFAIQGEDRSCFASPHDNTIWTYEAAGWQGQRAPGRNRCLTHVVCTDPVQACAELLYPQ